MNFRLTVILFLVALALVGGLLVMVLTDDKPATDTVLLAPLAGLKASDIEVVELVRMEPSEQKLVFARAGKDRWELREGNAGRLDSAAVNRTIESLLNLKPTAFAELSSDPAKHGLDKPGFKATLKSKASSGTLLIGDTTPGGDRAVTFVASGARPGTPLAVKRSEIAGLFRDYTKDGASAALARWASDYRLKKLIGVDLYDMTAQAKQIKFTVGGKEMILSRTGGTDWTFDAPAGLGTVDIAGDPAPKPEVITGLRSLTVMLNALQAAGPEDFIENPEPLQKYGLAADDNNLIRIEIVPNDGPPDVLLIGKKVEDSAPVKYFAKVPGEPAVVKVLGDRIPALVKTIDDPRSLQDRTLVKELDVPRIDAVEVIAGGSKTSLRKVTVAGHANWMLEGSSEPQKAGPAVTALFSALAQPRGALEALTAPADAMFAPAETKAEVKLWLDGLADKGDAKSATNESKLKGDPTMTLLFGKIDGNKAYCRRVMANGTKVDFLVPASLAALAAKKRGEYFDLKFKEFATNTARRLSFNRSAEPFEIERSEKAEADFPSGKWTFVKPDALKGQVVDSQVLGGSQLGAGLLGNLATLSAASVASENPNETELSLMGLTPAHPRMDAVVTLDDGKTRGYRFGNETADKAYVYFQQAGSPAAYLVPRVSLDSFLTVDLRDRTPYRFDTKDVKSIRLKGWKTNAVKEITLTRDGENWSIDGKPANPMAMMALLNQFRAPRPVAVVGGQTTEQGFDAAKGGDPLEVTFIGENDPIVVVTLGNTTDAGANLFAWNSKTKEVMTLPIGVFGQFKSGPEMFKK